MLLDAGTCSNGEPDQTTLGFPDPARDGFEARFYGVWVTEISDGATLLLLGHVPLLKAVAVGSRYAASWWGWANVADSYEDTLSDVAGWVRWEWAVRSGQCSVCDRGGDSYDCQCSEGSWWLRWVDDESVPGAFPVTTIRAYDPDNVKAGT
jgi:hypothetical protein